MGTRRTKPNRTKTPTQLFFHGAAADKLEIRNALGRGREDEADPRSNGPWSYPIVLKVIGFCGRRKTRALPK